MIYKFQQGGGLPPFDVYTPLVTPNQMPTQQVPNSQEKGVDNGILKILEKSDDLGLPNDVKSIMDDVRTLFSSGTDFTNPSSLTDSYINIIEKMKIAKYNLKAHDDARKQVISKDGLNEIAITDTGKVLTMDETGNPTFLDISKYDPRKHRLMTNDEVLYRRAYDNVLSFNNSALKIVNNGIGISNITELLEKYTKNLGSSEMTSEQSIDNTGKGKLVGGLTLLRQIMENGVDVNGVLTLEGLHENSLYTKDQVKQMQSAITYLSNTLPQNAKNLLQVKAKQNGTKVEDIILSLFNSKHNSEFKYTTNYNDDKGKSSGNKKYESEIKTNEVFRAQNGIGDSKNTIIQFGTSDGFNVDYKYYTTKSKGTPMGSSTFDEISTSDMRPILDMSNAYIGDKKIGEHEFGHIMTTDSELYVADLVVQSLDSNKPEISYIGKLENVHDLLKSEYGIDVRKSNDSELTLDEKMKINEVYNEHGIPVKYNDKGERNTLFKRFGIYNVWYNTDLDDLDGAFEIDSDEEDYVREMFKRKNPNKNLQFKEKDNYYKTAIIVPILQDRHKGVESTGDVKLGITNMVEAKQQHDINVKKFNKSSKTL